MPGAGPVLVPFAPHHTRGVLSVIGGVFKEYGATFEPAGFDADLTDIERSYLGAGGCFSVLEDGGEVVGTVAAVSYHGATCEIKRLYLKAEYRGRGFGRRLLESVLGWAEAAGYLAALAWSDTRFTIAHGVYERLGFVTIGERAVDDADRSREIGFRRRLRPRALTAAPACALCAIAAGTVKADRIVETERVVGFVNDIEPLALGHSVIFPRRHAASLHETTDGDLAAMMTAVKRLAAAMDLEHYNVLQNTGARAGQTVFHVHVHLIPKWTDADGLAVDRRAAGYIDQREIAHRIRERLR